MKNKEIEILLILSLVLPLSISCGKTKVEEIEEGHSFLISHGYVFMNGNKTFDLSVFDYPAGTTLTWKSSDESVVSVEGGVLSSHSKTGEADVTVSVDGSDLYRAVCSVRVVPDDWLTLGCGAIRMVGVEGGTFRMGEDKSQKDVLDPDKQVNVVHDVTLSSYAISDCEITVGLWESVMNPTAPKNAFNKETAYYPLTGKTYKEVVNFIEKLNMATGRRFHLPTEAQWEFAARGGVKTHDYMYSGSDVLSEVGVYFDNSSVADIYRIGLLRPNELGIYDMSGGVCEMCQDYYDQYTEQEVTDPTGPKEGQNRVIRGGSYISGETECTVFHRGWVADDKADQTIGFRLAE